MFAVGNGASQRASGTGGLWRNSSIPSNGILISMSNLTTIKVSVQTRDALRQLAARDGLTLDAQIDRLIRSERRRIIGFQLASLPLGADDVAMIDASAGDVADACG